MLRKLSYILLAVSCLAGLSRSLSYDVKSSAKKNSNIQFDKEYLALGAGSGGWMLNNSDDEDLTDGGSGSGSGMGETDSHAEKTTFFTSTTTMMTTSTTTGRPLTNCEKMRQASRQLVGRYVPRCLPNGDFDSIQCHGHTGTADCWCSDLEGREIPGTLMEAPNYPNCENGNNLPPCVHQLVQHVRSKLLGSFRPRCTVDGQFDRIQCRGSMCFCVDENTGNRVTGTEVHIPDKPKCDDDDDRDNDWAGRPEPEITTKKLTQQNVEGTIDIDGPNERSRPTSTQGSATIDLDVGVDSNVGRTETKKEEDDNKSADDAEDEGQKTEHEDHYGNRVEKAGEIMTKPGILAGIIGGSVVLLLCFVLLVMFIVYRMRKKDEGSYPLDEPRKTPNYNYVRAPEKEFYA